MTSTLMVRVCDAPTFTCRIRDELTPPPRQLYSVYVIELRGRAGADGIRSLRALLKTLGRRHGLRCISAREVQRDD